jgi:hypothetical protein
VDTKGKPFEITLSQDSTAKGSQTKPQNFPASAASVAFCNFSSAIGAIVPPVAVLDRTFAMPLRRSIDANTAGVTMDEASRLASNFAKLPELLGRAAIGFPQRNVFPPHQLSAPKEGEKSCPLSCGCWECRLS